MYFLYTVYVVYAVSLTTIGIAKITIIFPYKCMYSICYRSKLFLGNSIFKLVYFFQNRLNFFNLGQFASNYINLF